MAKKKTDIEKGNAGLPALPNYGNKYAGAGWDNTDSSDFAIPFLSLLQDLSKETKKKSEKYIEGAEPGMFMNSVTNELFPARAEQDRNGKWSMEKGHEPLIIVPCITTHGFIEWVPRDKGGGFVAAYQVDSPVVLEASRRAGGDIKNLKTKEKNDLVETFAIYCLLINEPGAEEFLDTFVISCAKSKIRMYRNLMSKLSKAGGKDNPLFAHQVKLSSFLDDSNPTQEFFNLLFEPAIGGNFKESMVQPDKNGDHPLLEYGFGLRQSVLKGNARANYDSVSGEEDGSGGGAPKDEHF